MAPADVHPPAALVAVPSLVLSSDAVWPLPLRRGLGQLPERERLALLRTLALGTNWAMMWAHSSASGRPAASPVQLAMRSAISCGHSSRTLCPRRDFLECQLWRSPVQLPQLPWLCLSTLQSSQLVWYGRCLYLQH